ncbi:MAG: hypothetical protein ACK5HA_13270 [Planctomycetaceae bacterium]|jgi:hypothetical protein
MRHLSLLMFCGLCVQAWGCAVLDPSCAVCRELTGPQAGRSLAYCPDTDLACIECHPWFGCPNSWTPGCDRSLICGPEHAPPADSARSVYALPSSLQMRESRREFQRDPKRSDLPRAISPGATSPVGSPRSPVRGDLPPEPVSP